MNRSSIAYLFDADGVLIRSDPFTHELERVHGIPRNALASFFKQDFPQCLTGHVDLKSKLAPLLEQISWKGSPSDFLNFWFESENKPDDDLLSRISDLKGQGYFIAVATNQEQRRTAFMKTKMGFSALFDEVFSSCELGYKKPQPEFYRKIGNLLEKKGIKKIRFFDDKVENVQAAAQVGWNAFHYQRIEDFLQHLSEQKQP